MSMSKEDYLQQIALMEEIERRLKYNKLSTMFPDDGKYKRTAYKKHMAFFKAGSSYSQRLLAGGNRVGKSQAGGFETVCHLTGLYPDWWEGRRFLNPIKAWAVGISNQVVREVQQLCLLGPLSDVGSGLIPKELLVGDPVRKAGVPEAVEILRVRHRSGGISEIVFKAYEQGRDSFQGTKKDWIWMDEEPREVGIYEECLMRTMDDISPGIIAMTFTPLLGLSALVRQFLPDGVFTDNGEVLTDKAKFAINVEWDDVPHLSEEQKAELRKSIAPHLLNARTKGLPSLGSGAIYPYNEDDIVIEPRELPFYWPRAYGLDVGWKRTAAIWVAVDPDSRVYYLYSEHYLGESVPAIHGSAIRSRGRWIPGVIDSAALATSQSDGSKIYDQYVAEDLDLQLADKAIEAGIARVSQLLAEGRLKVFNTLVNWLKEFRTYHRDEKTMKVADKQEDHLMDAMRYLIMACPDILRVEPDYDTDIEEKFSRRDSTTGY